MVYFQCEKCIATLKKKQVETHYLTVCKDCHQFRCLTCNQIFDRETIKTHTTCISEDEKYKKGDNMKKETAYKPKEKVVEKLDINTLKWSGFRKTTKKLLKSCEGYKLGIKDLSDKLAYVYANFRQASIEDVDMTLLKKNLMRKLENDSRFVIDLIKNTIRFKG